MSPPGHSETRLPATLPRLSAPRAAWSLHLSGLVLLSIVSDSKQVLHEYLLNSMEPATGRSHSPQVSPLQPERLAGPGAVCPLSSSEVSETACSLPAFPAAGNRRQQAESSRGRVTGRAQRGGPGRAQRGRAPGSQQSRLRWPLRAARSRRQRAPAGPRPHSRGAVWVSQHREDGEVSQCWAARHGGGRTATCSPARQGGRGMEKKMRRARARGGGGLPARREGRCGSRAARGMRCPLRLPGQEEPASDKMRGGVASLASQYVPARAS